MNKYFFLVLLFFAKNSFARGSNDSIIFELLNKEIALFQNRADIKSLINNSNCFISIDKIEPTRNCKDSFIHVEIEFKPICEFTLCHCNKALWINEVPYLYGYLGFINFFSSQLDDSNTTYFYDPRFMNYYAKKIKDRSEDLNEIPERIKWYQFDINLSTLTVVNRKFE